MSESAYYFFMTVLLSLVGITRSMVLAVLLIQSSSLGRLCLPVMLTKQASIHI